MNYGVWDGELAMIATESYIIGWDMKVEESFNTKFCSTSKF